MSLPIISDDTIAIDFISSQQYLQLYSTYNYILSLQNDLAKRMTSRRGVVGTAKLRKGFVNTPKFCAL